MGIRKKQLKEELVNACREFIELKFEKKIIDEELPSLRDEIIDYASKLGIDKIEISSDNMKSPNKKNVITVITTRKFSFDIDAIKENLDEDLANEIIDLVVIVEAPKKFIFTLKKIISVLPKPIRKKAANSVSKTFKKQEVVNRSKLDQLLDIGDITLDGLDGCYEVHESKSVRMN